MEFRKMVTITPYARQQKRHRCIEQCLLDSVGEREGGMIWENGTEASILSCNSPGKVNSIVQESESVIYTHISPLSILFF